MGDVTVGGTKANLNAVNSVLLYESTGDNNTTIRVFVPIAGISTSSVTRVPGVGIVGITTDIPPALECTIGTDMQSMISHNVSLWNDSINSTLSQNGSRRANSKVVPLYDNQNQVIGAAQVVGTSRGLTAADEIIASSAAGIVTFKATGTQLASGLNQVVVSALIFVPTSATTTPPSAITGPRRQRLPALRRRIRRQARLLQHQQHPAGPDRHLAATTTRMAATPHRGPPPDEGF